MSDAHKDQQGSLIRTPKQLIIAVIAGFVVPIICIVLLVQYVSNNDTVGAGSNSQSPEAISARLAPVADEGFTFRDVGVAKQLMSAADVYTSTCAACHASGVAGAPKTGDVGAWSARLAQGYDTVLSHAINGIGAMPAKGGNTALADVEVARAVVYMANESGASFKEPEVKEGVAEADTADENGAAAEVGADSATPDADAAPAASGDTAAPAPAAAAPGASAEVGKKIYDASCVACHSTGIAGSPKLGDKGAWAPRLAQGNDVLYTHAIQGFQGKTGMMPPRGGSTASDDEVKAAVDYMAAASQ